MRFPLLTMGVVLLLLVPEIGPSCSSPGRCVAIPEGAALAAPSPLSFIHC